MRDYGKVHTSFWASDTLRELGDEARLLALYLLTSPHTNMAGVFRLPEAYATEDMGWPAERLRNGFATLSDSGWLKRDERTGWTWIVKFGKWNPPDNPNQRKAAQKLAGQVPDTVPFASEVRQEWGLVETVSEPLGNLPSPSPVPSPAPKPRATRLPDDWSPSVEETAWAMAERPDLSIPREAATFRDYWKAKPKDNTRADWPATWRNWIRRANGPGGKPTDQSTKRRQRAEL